MIGSIICHMNTKYKKEGEKKLCEFGEVVITVAFQATVMGSSPITRMNE